MTRENTAPSINKTAFECPHCGVYTTQHWFELFGKRLSDEARAPFIPGEDFKNAIESDPDATSQLKQFWIDKINQYSSGLVFLEQTSDGAYCSLYARNLHLSECYNCRKVAVWVHDRLFFPSQKAGDEPNSDLPEDVLQDYEEARNIVNLSPRGSSALLRLCVQKLCKHLWEKGKDLDKDIGSLVSKGLNPLVQRSLDIVRVIGNESVHPGEINLNDDRDTAMDLFGIVNLIAEQMISLPGHIKSTYEQLPEKKRQAIEKRNAKSKGDQADGA